MSERMPAMSLAAVPGRRAQTIELAAEIEQRGFSGIYCPSFGDAMGLCLSIAQATTTIGFGTSIQPIYTAVNETDAASRLDEFHTIWGHRYPAIRTLWTNAWTEFVS